MKGFVRFALMAAGLVAALLGWCFRDDVTPDMASWVSASQVYGSKETLPLRVVPAAAVGKTETMRGREERSALSRRLAIDLAGEGGSGDLAQSLRVLGRLCGGVGHSDCQDEVLAGLPSRDRQRLRELLARLPLLAPQLSALVMSTRQPVLDRLNAISQVRIRVLGEADAQLLFGPEEAQLRYQAQLEQFIKDDAAGLPLAQRLKAAEALRASLPQGVLSKAKDDLSGRAHRYQLTLRLTLLDATDAVDAERLTHQVRRQFYSPQQSEQMARADHFDSRQQERMARYADVKREILDRYAVTNDPAALLRRDEELAALRREVFPDSFQAH